MSSVYTCYLGLGSNIEPRLDYLQQARDALAQSGRVTKKSAVYESPAYGVTDQADFLNCALCYETTRSPAELLRYVKATEQQLGRQKRRHWGPREIDIDILDVRGTTLNTPHLRLPHPELEKRLFVLQPLAEIAPNWHNKEGRAIDELLRAFEGRLPLWTKDW